MIQILLSKGANIDLEDKWGHTALIDADCCPGNNIQIQIIDTLLSHGANINHRSRTNITMVGKLYFSVKSRSRQLFDV
jgi:ankyrin repeat protein